MAPIRTEGWKRVAGDHYHYFRASRSLCTYFELKKSRFSSTQSKKMDMEDDVCERCASLAPPVQTPAPVREEAMAV